VEIAPPRIIKMRNFLDDRGNLIITEFDDLPFFPKRLFIQSVHRDGVTRGGHAHQNCDQIFLPLNGEVQVNIETSSKTLSFFLEDPTLGLYVPKMNWASEYFKLRSTKLLVLASEKYSQSDYIKSLIDFRKVISTSHSN
jgi:dTDP-4-dehydrorhamnose 3,5-epimerase-like enzyme